MTPERKKQLFAELDAEFGTKRTPPKPTAKAPTPKLVAEEGRIVADCEVVVSPSDFNARCRGSTRVLIDMAAYERQRAYAENDRAARARRQRELDPLNYGHWGSAED